jgi:predicted transcriptional regulator
MTSDPEVKFQGHMIRQKARRTIVLCLTIAAAGTILLGGFGGGPAASPPYAFDANPFATTDGPPKDLWVFPNSALSEIENASLLADHLASALGDGPTSYSSENGWQPSWPIFRRTPSENDFFDHYSRVSVDFSSSDGSGFRLYYDQIYASFNYGDNGSLIDVDFRDGIFLGFQATLVDSKIIVPNALQYEPTARLLGDALGIPTKNLTVVSYLGMWNTTTVILSSTLFGFDLSGCNIMAATFDNGTGRLVSVQARPFVVLPSAALVTPQEAIDIGRRRAPSLYRADEKAQISSDGLLGIRLEPVDEVGEPIPVPSSPGNYSVETTLRFAFGYEYRANVTSSIFSMNYPILIVVDIDSGAVLVSGRHPIPVPSGEPEWVVLDPWTGSLLILSFAGLIVLGVLVGPPEIAIALLGSFIVQLHVRLAGIDVLENFNRGKIYGYIQGKPGCSFTELKTELRFFNGNLAYHLIVLEKLELVRSVKDGRTRRYFLQEDGGRIMKTHFLGKVESRIFRVLNEKGPSPGMEVAKELSISRQLAHYNLRHLQKRGLAKLLDSRWQAVQPETSYLDTDGE